MPRMEEMARQVPLCTLAVATVCILLQVYVTVFDMPITNFTLAAANVIYLGEYYRIISAALLHGGAMHIIFNMLSFLSIGSGLEMAIGTVAMAFTIFWSIILAGVVYVAAEWAMTVWVTNDPQYAYQHAVGFSGVIFTLALIESYRSSQPTRSMYGMMQVPTRMYPWILLVVLSVMMPGISFMGHLSGVLVGMMHVYGYTKPIMPSAAHFAEMDNYGFVRNNIGQMHNFCPAPQLLPGATDSAQLASCGSPREICGLIAAGIGAGRRSLCDFVHSAMGRTRGSNAALNGDVEGTGTLLGAQV